MALSIVSTLNRPDRPPIGPYSELSIVPLPPTNPTAYLLQTAGQIGVSPSTATSRTQIPLTFQEQAVNAFTNVAAVLALKGATLRDITKFTIYVPNLDTSKRDLLAEVILNFLGEGVQDEPQHQPPSTLIGVARLASPEFLIEVEATAVVATP